MRDTLKDLIPQVITEDAMAHRVRYAEKFNLHEEVYFWSNLEKCLRRYIDGELLNSRSNMLGDLATKGDLFNSINPDIAKIKKTYEVINELRQELIDRRGQCTYENDFAPIVDYKESITTNELEKALAKQDHWRLNKNIGELNYFCWEDMKQKYSIHTVYQLVSKHGTTCEFDSATTEGEILHILFFQTSKTLRSKFFHTLSEFRSLLRLLIDSTSAEAVYSPYLSYPTADELSTLTQEQIDGKLFPESWRFKKLNDSEDSKLLRMWQRVGGILLPIDNMNPDNLYFNSAKKALETKALYREHYPDDPNPYRYVSNKSIYDADTVKELRS